MNTVRLLHLCLVLIFGSISAFSWALAFIDPDLEGAGLVIGLCAGSVVVCTINHWIRFGRSTS